MIKITANPLLAVLGEHAHARDITAKKTAHMMSLDNSVVTGFVLTDPTGHIMIVDKAAVRGLSDGAMWQLMHPENLAWRLTP